MTELNGGIDYAVLFAIAAALGAIGGLGYELMQTRGRGQTGLIERPHRSSKRLFDLGAWASVVIGAIAAAAALWVFPPEITIIGTGAAARTVRQYDLIRVVGLSLIIGSAGSSFLSALQARALAQVKAQEAQTTRQLAAGQLTDIKADIAAGAPQDKLLGRVEAAEAAVNSTAQGNPTEADF
jgi:hypothetical protein